MMELSTLTVGYKQYPHVDTYDCGRKVMNLLYRHLKEKQPMYQTVVQLPWHIAPAQGVSLSGPVYDIVEYMARLERTGDRVWDVSFFHGFPYADVPFAGASVTAVAASREEAERVALDAARYAWSRRYDMAVKPNSAAEALELALQAEAPVVINESSDNPGGGAPGDGTHLLREMLERDIPGSVYGYIHDPEVVQLALAAGVGGTFDCRLGGKRDNLHGTPIEIKGAYVKTISDGKFIKKNPMGAGGLANYGPTVLLQVGNVGVVVSGARSQTLDDGPFRIVGVDWRDMRILALKSSQHFKGWWVGRAKTIIPCDSPGIHSADLSLFDHKQVNKNYFPFGDPEWN
jgi:microcystin degradation protein MlrC